MAAGPSPSTRPCTRKTHWSALGLRLRWQTGPQTSPRRHQSKAANGVCSFTEAKKSTHHLVAFGSWLGGPARGHSPSVNAHSLFPRHALPPPCYHMQLPQAVLPAGAAGGETGPPLPQGWVKGGIKVCRAAGGISTLAADKQRHICPLLRDKPLTRHRSAAQRRITARRYKNAHSSPWRPPRPRMPARQYRQPWAGRDGAPVPPGNLALSEKPHSTFPFTLSSL